MPNRSFSGCFRLALRYGSTSVPSFATQPAVVVAVVVVVVVAVFVVVVVDVLAADVRSKIEAKSA